MEKRAFVLVAEVPPLLRRKLDVWSGRLYLLFFWQFLLFVSPFHLDQCEGCIYISMLVSTAMKKYDRVQNKGKRFIDPVRSQLIETIGTIAAFCFWGL